MKNFWISPLLEYVLLTHLDIFRVLRRKDKLTENLEGFFRAKNYFHESCSEVFSNASLFNLWHYFILQMITITLEYKHIMYQKANVTLKVLVVSFSEEKTWLCLLNCFGLTMAGCSLVSSISLIQFISMANIFLCAKLKSYMLLFCKELIY